jgi:hypothetical protein
MCCQEDEVEACLLKALGGSAVVVVAVWVMNKSKTFVSL